MIKIISREDVEKIIEMNDVIHIVEKAFLEYHKGATITPIRTNLRVEKENGNVLFMPSYLKSTGALGIKIVSVYPDNSKKNMQTIHSTILLQDANTGESLALMDGEYITALRTGAVSGIAAKYLSREDSSVVTIFGAGNQARTQLEAICAVRDIKKVYVHSFNESRKEVFCKEMSQKLKVNVSVAQEENQYLSHSDIIITATTSRTPVFVGNNLKKGVFISGIGSYTPNMQEVPEDIVKNATVIVDAYDMAIKEAGDIIIPINKGIITKDHIKGELGEVITGKVKRKSNNEIIFFKSVGLAIQDMSVAQEVYVKSLKHNLGVDVNL